MMLMIKTNQRYSRSWEQGSGSSSSSTKKPKRPKQPKRREEDMELEDAEKDLVTAADNLRGYKVLADGRKTT
jgi:hypothetical protein